MNPTALSLIAATTALAAVTGIAALEVPTDGSGADARATTGTTRLPVERSVLLCPAPATSELAETQYTAFTPGSGAARETDEPAAELLPAAPASGSGEGAEGRNGDGKGKKGAGGDAEPALSAERPGTPGTADADGPEAPALIGSAHGRLAPGWTVQQTTTVPAGVGRGLLGTSCSAPDTEFWFPGVSTADGRHDYIHLTNPDDTPAVADLRPYGKDGAVTGESGEGITVPARSTVRVLLSTLTDEPMINFALHVVARSGRVGAQVHAVDEKLGSDWLPAAAAPEGSVVLPGIPADATSVRLVAVAPEGHDASLQIRLAGSSGTFTPARQETLHVRSGTVVDVDLADLTKGEPGSLVLTPEEGDETGEAAPVAAALRVTRGKGSSQEMAFIPGTAPVEERATAADNRAEGSTLSLVAPEETVKVKVTASAGSGGGSTVSETHTIEGGTTMAVEPPRPPGGKAARGRYALTVERLSGGPLYAARILVLPDNGVPMFTVQTLPDDRGSVDVPDAEQDLGVLTE